MSALMPTFIPYVICIVMTAIALFIIFIIKISMLRVNDRLNWLHKAAVFYLAWLALALANVYYLTDAYDLNSFLSLGLFMIFFAVLIGCVGAAVIQIWRKKHYIISLTIAGFFISLMFMLAHHRGVGAGMFSVIRSL